jgi:iron complex transport system ATP-binding protein
MGEANLTQIRKSVRLVQPAGPYDVDPALTTRQVVQTGYFGTIGLYDPVTPEMEAEADRLVAQVGLAHVADHSYATLSSGERVRGLIARALVVRPALLLLDEPTAGLDLLAREQVLATVQRLFEDAPGTSGGGAVAGVSDAARPPTTLFITHHVEELPPATSHVLLLSGGRVAARGTPADVLRADVLSPVYGCPLQVRRSNDRYYVEVHPGAWERLLEGQ